MDEYCQFYNICIGPGGVDSYSAFWGGKDLSEGGIVSLVCFVSLRVSFYAFGCRM